MLSIYRSVFAIILILCSYVALSNQLFVDPTGQRYDSDYVYSTIMQAINSASQGDVILIAPGVYRESIILKETQNAPKVGLTIKGDTGEEVVIKGSDVVENWILQKNGNYAVENWKVEPQQVFIDGRQLTQIGGTVFGGYPNPEHELYKRFSDRLWPGRLESADKIEQGSSVGFFWFDRSERKLVISVPKDFNLSKSTVEVSVRPYLFLAKGWNGLVVENLTFIHSNSSTNGRHGAVSIWGNDHVLRSIKVLEADSVGLHVVGNDILVVNSDFSRAGRLGILGRGERHTYLNNSTNENNSRGFLRTWEAGGAKFVGSGGISDSIVDHHVAVRNKGSGIWFDWFNKNNIIKSSVTAYNVGHGIHYEASFGGHIQGNVSYGNSIRGIYLIHSSDNIVACNIVAFNGMEGVVTVDEGRRSTTGDLEPRNNRIIGNLIGLNSRNMNNRADLVVANTGRNHYSDQNLFLAAVGKEPLFSIRWPRLTNPWVRGLTKWQKHSDFDLHSAVKHIDLPASVLSTLEEKRVINFDFLSPIIDQLDVGSLPDDFICAAPGRFAIDVLNRFPDAIVEPE